VTARLAVGFGLALSAAGCGAQTPQETPMPGQDQALAIVWRGAFNAAQDPPPVSWSELHVDGGSKTAVEYDGHVYSGIFTDDGVAMVAWRGSFHDSAFAHELMHALQSYEDVIDPDHKRDKDWKLVKKANDALEDAGL
jgi:hypothetical protein